MTDNKLHNLCFVINLILLKYIGCKLFSVLKSAKHSFMSGLIISISSLLSSSKSSIIGSICRPGSLKEPICDVEHRKSVVYLERAGPKTPILRLGLTDKRLNALR